MEPRTPLLDDLEFREYVRLLGGLSRVVGDYDGMVEAVRCLHLHVQATGWVHVVSLVQGLLSFASYADPCTVRGVGEYSRSEHSDFCSRWGDLPPASQFAGGSHSSCLVPRCRCAALRIAVYTGELPVKCECVSVRAVFPGMVW